ncbi:hypothetical protein RM550_18880 [Streptomyces sp. DSM 41527]|uniref:Uncharacterized protein n=1 Tax=Streptomyces mooreae TaxID=3075523 RepID=A0ABU2TA40_9ACTN|nr:hypothetical protein [Streptomyces sp. DSM 41527]MDT0457777.1 hypothetical protein [Streptomyces sp. DSM 41527]
MDADPSEYDKAIPGLAAHRGRIERALGRTQATHAGRSFATVREALVEALGDEGAQRVVPQVIDEFARRISEEPDHLPL